MNPLFLKAPIPDLIKEPEKSENFEKGKEIQLKLLLDEGSRKMLSAIHPKPILLKGASLC